MSTQKIIDQILIFLNLYQQAKNESTSLIFSGDIVHLRMLRTDWQTAFWHISQEQDSYQI